MGSHGRKRIVGLVLVAILCSGCAEDEIQPTQLPDTEAPAAVNDLQVVPDFSSSDGIVRWRVTWTAAGDDSMEGTATVVILRYSNSPIEEKNWKSAAVLTVLSDPPPGGAVQSFLLESAFDLGTWFFALRSVDEAANESPRSNNARHEAGPTSADRMASSFIESYRRRDLAGFEALIDGDFVFHFAPEDLEHSPNGSGVWDRAAELTATTRIFSAIPGTIQAPVDGISIVLTPLDPQWLEAGDAQYVGTRQRRYQVLMEVRHSDGGLSRITGVQRFHVAIVEREIRGYEQTLWTLRHWLDFGRHQPREPRSSESMSWGAFKAGF